MIRRKEIKFENEIFRLAVENAFDHIIITDDSGRILFANKAVERITGYSKKEIIGRNPSLWGRQMDKDFYKNFWNKIKSEKKPFVGEITNRRKKGELYVAEIHVSPILEKNGKVKYFVGIERDITKEKEIDKAKTEFISFASHELRTPITIIGLNVEMLLSPRTGMLSDVQKQYIDEISDGNKKMVETIKSLMDVTKTSQGVISLTPLRIDVASVMENTIKLLHGLTAPKKLSVIQTYEKNSPSIMADPSLLAMIFQNILTNAIKYTRENGKILVKICRIKKGQKLAGKTVDRESISITIADDGFGIPKKEQKEIFSKFFRATNAKNNKAEGIGIGLYLTKTLVDKLKGKIWMKSKENKGTTFFIIIPIINNRE